MWQESTWKFNLEAILEKLFTMTKIQILFQTQIFTEQEYPFMKTKSKHKVCWLLTANSIESSRDSFSKNEMELSELVGNNKIKSFS